MPYSVGAAIAWCITMGWNDSVALSYETVTLSIEKAHMVRTPNVVTLFCHSAFLLNSTPELCLK